MNAKQAKLTAQRRAAEINKEREEASRKKREEAAKKWSEERANWQRNQLSYIEESIKAAANKGQTKTSIWLASSEKRERAEEEVFWEGFAFATELKKVIAHFKKLGYQLKFGVKTRENVDLSDLNPRDNWFTYETVLEISW